jgi:hypothetical protein
VADPDGEVSDARYLQELQDEYNVDMAADSGADYEDVMKLREDLALTLDGILAAKAAVRRDTLLCMAGTMQAQAAVARIEAAWLSWRFSKEVLWNPNTELGRRRALTECIRISLVQVAMLQQCMTCVGVDCSREASLEASFHVGLYMQQQEHACQPAQPAQWPAVGINLST